MKSREFVDRFAGIDTPFYFYDMDLLRRTLDTLQSEASKYGFITHYAVKANFDPRVIAEIKSHGIGIDCASGNEVRCGIEAGVDPSLIVYAGVGKRDKEIRYALEQGIFSLNCESIEEIHVIGEIAKEMGKTAHIALRVNPDVDPKTNKCINTGQADCKFGISYEEIVARAAEIQAVENVEVHGMHIHIGSQIRDMSVFVELCDKANALIKGLTELGFNLDFIDLGGGLGINYQEPDKDSIPDFAGIFKIVSENLNNEGRPVHFEFGRALVAQCGELITRAVYNKTTATGRKLVIIDGSMTELIRPMIYGAYHEIENLTSKSDTIETYTVVGTACESTDVFQTDTKLPVTRRGDILTVKSAGAYGMSMSSRYNLHDIPAAVYSDEL